MHRCLPAAGWLVLMSLLGMASSCGPSSRRVLAEAEPVTRDSLPQRELLAAPLAIAGLATVFADEFTQWDLFNYEGERAGDLKLRFPPVAGQGGDFTQWTFRMGDASGTVRPKIRGREDLWEIRVDNEVATVRTLFPGRFDQWSIQASGSRMVYVVRDYALLEFWSLRGPGGPGRFEVFTRFEGDPRDWEVYHELTHPLSPSAQMAMVWLPVYMRLTAASRQ